MAHQPLETVFFPNILVGLVGRLGLAPPSVANPPTSTREGVAHYWAGALREAVRMTEGDVNPEQVTGYVVPHGLHLNYVPDFQTRRMEDIANTHISFAAWPH